MCIDYIFKARLTTPVSNFFWEANEIHYNCPGLSLVLQFGIFNSVVRTALGLQKLFIFRTTLHHIHHKRRDKNMINRPVHLLFPIEKENILTKNTLTSSISIQILNAEKNDNTMIFFYLHFN